MNRTTRVSACCFAALSIVSLTFVLEADDQPAQSDASELAIKKLFKGFLDMESERAEIHFRKIDIMELPGGRAEDFGHGA